MIFDFLSYFYSIFCQTQHFNIYKGGSYHSNLNIQKIKTQCVCHIIGILIQMTGHGFIHNHSKYYLYALNDE